MTTQQLHENDRQPSLSVVGIGLRLPGARDKKEFFELLKEGRSAISRVPDNRWNPDRMTAPGGIPGKVVTDLGGFVEPHTDIDLLEFGISPAEAKSLDPHQAMLVEGVFQALEDSGVHYRGTNTGVFVTGSPDVHNLGNDMYNMGPYSATGAAFSMQANRLSYMFDLRGPSVYLDTACSSSITCLHLARTAILRGDCDMAVVAAVNVILAPHASLSFSTLGTLSPTGICHTFDSSADGYSRGEGCTVIILQRTKDAIDKGSHIYAEITGTSINANGKGSRSRCLMARNKRLLRTQHTATRDVSHTRLHTLNVTVRARLWVTPLKPTLSVRCLRRDGLMAIISALAQLRRMLVTWSQLLVWSV